jgi:hypothetical protein
MNPSASRAESAGFAWIRPSGATLRPQLFDDADKKGPMGSIKIEPL